MNVVRAELTLPVKPGNRDILESFLMRQLCCQSFGYLENPTPLKSARENLEKSQRISVKNTVRKSPVERTVLQVALGGSATTDELYPGE